MKVSTKGRYGIRLMVDLAIHFGQGYVLLKDAAKRMEISVKYLEHLVAPLKAAGFLRSVPGPRGGYQLSKKPSEIRLSQISQILEGSTALVGCVEDSSFCQRVEFCSANELWKRIRDAMENILESTSLEDLAQIQREKEKKNIGSDLYQI